MLWMGGSVGSDACGGSITATSQRTHTPSPSHPSRCSKTLAEKAAWEFSAKEGLDVVCVNPGFVIGTAVCAWQHWQAAVEGRRSGGRAFEGCGPCLCMACPQAVTATSLGSQYFVF